MKPMNDRTLKKRSAYWRGERKWIFLRRILFVAVILIGIAALIGSYSVLRGVFLIKDISISGNTRLAADDLKNIMGIKQGISLLGISLGDLRKRLMRSPWIKDASLRKDFPTRLQVMIKEAVPEALLDYNGNRFIIDNNGRILDELKGERTPFLPVLSNMDPVRDIDTVKEALRLVEALKKKDILSKENLVEITATGSNGLTMNMDGIIVKMGIGGYDEKLSRWDELKKEIKRLGIKINYIDLRFSNRVIVKPTKEVIEGNPNPPRTSFGKGMARFKGAQ